MDDFTVLVARYGIAAVFLLTFLENIGLPIPVFPVLMLAGAVRVRPASFHRHAHHLPRDRDLVFYCT